MTTLPEIPPLGPEPPKEFSTFFYWFRTQWQKAYEAIREAFTTIETTITDLEDTQDTQAALLETVTEQGIELADAVGLLNTTVGIADDATEGVETLGDRVAEIESAATYSAAGIDMVPGAVLSINATQIVGAQGAAVADAVNAVGVPTQAEFNAFVTQFNALKDRIEAHGLIAP